MKHYVIINEEACDNSQYCWFLKNCPFKVFAYNNGKISVNENKCRGCHECDGHCDVVMIADSEEERRTCIRNINKIEVVENSSSQKIFGTEPFDSDNVFDVNIDSSQQIDVITKSIKECKCNLIVELSSNDALICRYAGIPFKDLADIIQEEVGEFEHKTIFTGDNKEAFKKFCDFFELTPDVIAGAPLLIFYNNGKVYHIYHHGPQHFKNFDKEQFRKEMQITGEKYVSTIRNGIL